MQGDDVYYEKIHKIIVAAISIVLGAGGAFYIKKEINNFKDFIHDLDNSNQVIVLGMILGFLLIFFVFFVKPIALASIRWRTFKKMHSDELLSNTPTNKKLTQNKIEPLSKTLFNELDEVDKESKEDLDKIEKIVDYQEKRKSE